MDILILMEIARDALRRVLGTYATGVSIVMTKSRGTIHGLTVNSFTSVSLDPPLILVCIDRMTATYPLMKESRIFSVNILSNVQESLSKLFSDPGNKSSMLQGLEYREEVTGAPILLGVLGFLDCSVEATYQWGDHDIFLAKVEKFGLGTEADPLLYYRGGYHSLR